MLTERIIKCPICGKPYVFYAFYAGDQSACPACRAEARKPIKRKVDGDWREYYDIPAVFRNEPTLNAFK